MTTHTTCNRVIMNSNICVMTWLAIQGTLRPSGLYELHRLHVYNNIYMIICQNNSYITTNYEGKTINEEINFIIL